MEKQILEMLKNMNERFDKIDKKFDKMDERFDKMDERFDKMDERFDRLESKIDTIENQIFILVESNTEIKADVKAMRHDLSRVEIGTAANWQDIARIKAKIQ